MTTILIIAGIILAILCVLLSINTYRVYQNELPSFEQLHNIEPSLNTKVFDRNGNFKDAFGGRGNAPGSVNYPTYLWMDAGGELLLTDSLNFRLQRLRKDGQFVHMFGENGDRPGDLSRPKGVATDSYGHVYVVDALMHALQIFNRNGGLLLSIGQRGQAAGEFWLPNGIFITRDNLIFVADSYNKRIQVFRYIGNET